MGQNLKSCQSLKQLLTVSIPGAVLFYAFQIRAVNPHFSEQLCYHCMSEANISVSTLGILYSTNKGQGKDTFFSKDLT